MLTVSLAPSSVHPPEPASPHPGCPVLPEPASGGHLDTGSWQRRKPARAGAGKQLQISVPTRANTTPEPAVLQPRDLQCECVHVCVCMCARVCPCALCVHMCAVVDRWREPIGNLREPI